MQREGVLTICYWYDNYKHPNSFEANCQSPENILSRRADVGGFLSPGCRVSIKFKSCNDVLFFGHLTKEGEFAISFLSPMAFPTMCFDCICRWPTKSRGEWCMYWVFWNVLDTNRIISSCPGIATNGIVPNLLANKTSHWFASLHRLGILLWKAFLLIEEEALLLLELQKKTEMLLGVGGFFALSQELVIC